MQTAIRSRLMLTLFKPMDFSVKYGTVVYFEGSQVIIYLKIVFRSLMIDFVKQTVQTLIKSRVMHAAFHLGPDCLSNYPFQSFWSSNG